MSPWQVLKFDAYFQEDVPLSTEEHYRIRQVGIYYYLEDDTISVTEPVVKNSGIRQGKLIRRHRVPKNDHGDHYHWKDLNRGINITMYGRTYRIVDCDPFTQVSSLYEESVMWNPRSYTGQDLLDSNLVFCICSFHTEIACDLSFYILWRLLSS